MWARVPTPRERPQTDEIQGLPQQSISHTMPVPMASSQACDRCSSRKEQCRFDDRARDCQNCMRSYSQCSFRRRIKRKGRPPVAKPMPHGRYEILTFEEPGSKIPGTAPAPAAPADETSLAGVRRGVPSQPYPVDSIGQVPRQDSESCSDPVQEYNGDGGGDSDSDDNEQSESWKEIQLLLMEDDAAFYNYHKFYMICPKFNKPWLEAIRTVLPASEGHLIHVYQVIKRLFRPEGTRMRYAVDTDVMRGARLLKNLAKIPITSDLHAGAMLMVSQVLAINHISLTCTSPYAICRNAIFTIKPFYESLLQNHPWLDPITITPLFNDVVECLARRMIPVARIPSCDRLIIDRMAGLCWTLMPLMYELCERSVQGRTEDASCPLSSTSERQSQAGDLYTSVEDKIIRWEPRTPTAFYEFYTVHEAMAMLLQARVYRCALLLIIHRLRHPFGEKDAQALERANDILVHLVTFFESAPDELKNLPVGFPLLVAMMENREMGVALLPFISTFHSHPEYPVRFKGFVDNVWNARQAGFEGKWFDLVEDSQLPIMP
jgi:hypothetical protein